MNRVPPGERRWAWARPSDAGSPPGAAAEVVVWEAGGPKCGDKSGTGSVEWPAPGLSPNIPAPDVADLAQNAGNVTT